LHTDGTSKFGKHYGTYDIVTDEGDAYLAGIREVSGGDTETQLNVLKELLGELDDSSNNINDLKKIVVSIKNIMSDRHIVQKKFNGIFQEYCTTLLPKVVSGWENLEPSCQNHIKKINDFFCGMHYVVGLADQAEVALKCWDKLLFEETAVGSLAHGGYSKGESGTYRLIRTLCKSVQTRGCEKSGRISDFESFIVNDVGLKSVPFIPFKGNRFNILFYNGGVTYYLRDHCKRFFENVKDDNKLLEAVFHDLQIPSLTINN